MTDARILYELALPLYEQLFAERKQKLLYVVPWPPSGIWSAVPLDNIAALNAWLAKTSATKPIHHRLAQLWASSKLPGAMTDAEKKALLKDLNDIKAAVEKTGPIAT